MESLLSLFGVSGGSGGLAVKGGDAKSGYINNTVNSIVGKTPLYVDWEGLATKALIAVALVLVYKKWVK